MAGENSIGEFYSVALTNNYQQADTGTKMIHVAPNTRSRIVSKGISSGNSKNTYRGQVKIGPKAHNSVNYSQCDSMLIGDKESVDALLSNPNVSAISFVGSTPIAKYIYENAAKFEKRVQAFHCEQRLYQRSSIEHHHFVRVLHCLHCLCAAFFLQSCK